MKGMAGDLGKAMDSLLGFMFKKYKGSLIEVHGKDSFYVYGIKHSSLEEAKEAIDNSPLSKRPNNHILTKPQ